MGIFGYFAVHSDLAESMIVMSDIKPQYRQIVLDLIDDYGCRYAESEDDILEIHGSQNSISLLDEEFHALQYKVEFLENCFAKESAEQ